MPNYAFNAKELDEENNMYYYSARYYAPPTFISRDPMFEKYPSISPYTYCANNPMKFVDPTGMVAGDFMDENGVIIGNDGINDGKLYALKNEAISTKVLRATKKFIKENSGNTEAFRNNDIAYKNSIEIEGDESKRQTMYNIVSLDDGNGGTSDNNNREHGGYIENGEVIQVPSGPIANPKYDKFATIGLPKGKTTFESHPSGDIVEGPVSDFGRQTIGATTTYRFTQSPSSTDMNNAGNVTRYVFGMGNQKVYIFNSNGVQATIPMENFVKPIK
jgi:RHS repeat-associated protein